MFDLNFTFLGISSIMFGIFLISIIIWIYALINCITSKKETDEKIIWVLIIIFLNIIGAIIYLIFNANDTKIISKTKDGEVKRLYRSRKDSIIGGVCGGLANYFKIDPVIVRLIFVILFFIKGSGLLFYIIAWIIIPLEPKNVENKKIEEKNKTKLKTKKTKNKSLTILIILLIVFFSIAIFFSLFFLTLGFINHKFTDYNAVNKKIIDKVSISDDKIKVGNFDISKNEIVYDRFNRVKDSLKNLILNDYNYVSNNGSNLIYLGVTAYDKSECQKHIGREIYFKDNCYKLTYQFDINSKKLPNNVNKFQVEGLFVDYELLNINYIEIFKHEN